jgi:uncharacterized protein (DUF305 family)
MDKNTIVIALLVLVVGFGGGYIVRGNQIQMPGAGSHMMSSGTMMENNSMGMGGTMDSMMQGLAGKEGDEFDRAFIEEMIVHHEGAVMMAQAAPTSAKHSEIKQMAQDIITAQTREIEMMEGWQKAWYGN